MDSLAQIIEHDKCDLLSAAAALYISHADATAILRSEALLTLHSKHPSSVSLLNGAMVAVLSNEDQPQRPRLATVQGADMEQPRKGSTVDGMVHDGLMLQLQDGSSKALGSLSTQPQLSSFSALDLGRMAARLNWQAFVGEHTPRCRYAMEAGIFPASFLIICINELQHPAKHAVVL